MVGIDMSEIAMLLPFAVAALMGLLIGLERELRRKAAGIGTNVLIATGACIFTLLSIRADPGSPARIAANILTGIGFIGAGLILKERDGNIHGLTTAAGIWLTAAVGMAVGFGFYIIASAGTIVAVFAPRFPGWLHRHHDDVPSAHDDHSDHRS